MLNPAPNTLAILGAGPIGLESAALALELGLDVHLFERGEVGAHATAWGHADVHAVAHEPGAGVGAVVAEARLRC